MERQINRVKVPKKPISLMAAIYTKVLPPIHRQLSFWKRKAEAIPNPELRKQALASIASKQFHCEGGGIYILLAPQEKREKVATFIVAYQTISDYLDNLCDRSLSLDPVNFRCLHQAMFDAVSGGKSTSNYYAYQEHQDDGGYLDELVKACQDSLKELPVYEGYQANVLTLCQLYCDLQVHKHIHQDRREEALTEWWMNHQDMFSQLEWYEFAAATGSTLGIFYLISLSSSAHYSDKMSRDAFEAYFPYVQGIHILLDYFIDQSEDRQGGDLNFCFYYASEEQKYRRLDWFYRRAQDSVEKLPNPRFHKMIIEGLLGIYLSDLKVKKQKDVSAITRRLLKTKAWSTRFFHLNCWLLHRKGKKV
jgi:tetraprenyl-beta-curcumene synthase